MVIAARFAPWLLAAVASFFTLQGLLAQVAIQRDLNTAMTGVLQSVRQAGKLTQETAQAMAPLEQTTATLERMNGRLSATRADMVGINGALDRLLQQQTGLLEALGSLNEGTSGVTRALTAAGEQNEALLSATSAMAGQTVRQAGTLERLSELTEGSIAHLGELNRRLAFLR